jgi:Sec7-like guanine-nucleotide exchange factor
MFCLMNFLLQGIRWLVENNLIQNTSESIAAFLFNETGLSKRAIGDYLGERYLFIEIDSIYISLLNRDDFNIEVLKHFAHLYDFFSIDIVEALRFSIVY